MLVYYMFQSWKMSLGSFYHHFELVVVLFLWLFFVLNHRFWSIFPMKTSLTTDNQLWWNMNQNKIKNLQTNLILSYWNPYNDFDVTYPYLVLVRLVLLQLHLKFSIKDWCYLIMTYLIKGIIWYLTLKSSKCVSCILTWVSFTPWTAVTP